MPPAERDSDAPQARPLFFLTREELGAEFSYACRVALAGARSRRRGGTAAWIHHPMVEAVLNEITQRYYDDEAERDTQLALAGLLQATKQHE